MSTLRISDKIPALEPRRTEVCVVANGRTETLTLLVEVGGKLSTLRFDAAGWRAVHAATGTPPIGGNGMTSAGRPLFPRFLNTDHARS